MSKTDDQILKDAREMGGYMQKSRIAWLWYLVMRALMVVEGVLWTLMDWMRRSRMSVAAKINRNYKIYADNQSTPRE